MSFNNQTEIEDCFLNFFQNLWASSSHLPTDFIFKAMPDDFATLSDEDRDELIKPLSKKEVFHALKLMSCGKSPGLEGLVVDFYVFYWMLLVIPFSKLFLTSSLLLIFPSHEELPLWFSFLRKTILFQ